MSWDSRRGRLRAAAAMTLATGMLGASVLAASPAAALPSQTLLYSVDGGATWSPTVTAAPGSQVIARAWFNNDGTASLPFTSITATALPGFTVVPNSTMTCLSPATSNPAMPGTEQKCSTDAGQGGTAVDSSVWSGGNLTISPSNGLFGEPTTATSGYMAAGKIRYVNLQQCVYNGSGVDNYTNLVNVPNDSFDSGTNVSNTADASQSCGPGTAGYPYVPQFQTSGVSALDLLGNRFVNLQQCVYHNGQDNYVSLVDVPNNGFDAGTNASNTSDTTQSCASGSTGYPYVPQFNTSGVTSMDLLNNRYINLHQCVYNGAADNYTSLVNVPDNGFDAGTNASNTVDASQSCGSGGPGYPYVPQFQTSGVTTLDTLDTTRGEGFVQYTLVAPMLTTSQPFSQTATLNGTGMATSPSSTGVITVDPALAIPLVNPQAGGVALLAALAGTGWIILRRNRSTKKFSS